jgi:hypothetical protein
LYIGFKKTNKRHFIFFDAFLLQFEAEQPFFEAETTTELFFEVYLCEKIEIVFTKIYLHLTHLHAGGMQFL